MLYVTLKYYFAKKVVKPIADLTLDVPELIKVNKWVLDCQSEYFKRKG